MGACGHASVITALRSWRLREASFVATFACCSVAADPRSWHLREASWVAALSSWVTAPFLAFVGGVLGGYLRLLLCRHGVPFLDFAGDVLGGCMRPLLCCHGLPSPAFAGASCFAAIARCSVVMVLRS